jgi:hypothetical protein
VPSELPSQNKTPNDQGYQKKKKKKKTDYKLINNYLNIFFIFLFSFCVDGHLLLVDSLEEQLMM